MPQKNTQLYFVLVVLCMGVQAYHISSKTGPEEPPGRVLYDQRQEGEWNVRADLKDFVILIIPATQQSSTPPSPAGAGGLLDFLTRAVPVKRGHLLKKAHGHHTKKVQHQDPAQETRHFIEAKAAPYHVDISTSRSNLKKLHPEATTVDAEEIVIAKSPTIALLKNNVDTVPRNTRAVVLTVPQDDVLVSSKNEEKSEKTTKREVEDESVMKLLGAENEQCGPGLQRDSQGVCRTVKTHQ